ncbi:hypothetical protein ABEF93_004194 [Exophiala dermatitidis]
MTLILIFGYGAFVPWSVTGFFQNYTMQIVAPILYFGWKLFKRTKTVKPRELDLIWERPVIDAYEASFISRPIEFWTEMGQLVGIKRHLRDDERITNPCTGRSWERRRPGTRNSGVLPSSPVNGKTDFGRTDSYGWLSLYPSIVRAV